jgi:chromosome segregation ATPase
MALFLAMALLSSVDLAGFRRSAFSGLRSEILGNAAADRIRFLDLQLEREAACNRQMAARLVELTAELEESTELMRIGDERSAVLQNTLSATRASLQSARILASELKLAQQEAERLLQALADADAEAVHKGSELERTAIELREANALKGQLMRELAQADVATHAMLQTLKEQCSTLAQELELAQAELMRVKEQAQGSAEAIAALGAANERADKLQRKLDSTKVGADQIATLKQQCSTLAQELELAQAELMRVKEQAQGSAEATAALGVANERADKLQRKLDATKFGADQVATLKQQCSTLAQELELAQAELMHLQARGK